MSLEDIERRLEGIETSMKIINFELGKLLGAQKTTATLIKYVILPLIIILGGLVGIKIV